MDGLLFDPEEDPSLIAAFQALTDDGARAKGLAEMGQKKAREEYDWDAITGKLIGIYDEVLHENSVCQ